MRIFALTRSENNATGSLRTLGSKSPRLLIPCAVARIAPIPVIEEVAGSS